MSDLAGFPDPSPLFDVEPVHIAACEVCQSTLAVEVPTWIFHHDDGSHTVVARGGYFADCPQWACPHVSVHDRREGVTCPVCAPCTCDVECPPVS